MTHTHLEEANQELRKIQERLIHTEKMAAIGEMATAITHEIRNPLVSVGGFARRLRDRLTDNPSLKKYAEIICLEADRLEKILQEILIFSKEAVSHCAPADINAIILEALDLLQEILTAKEIQVETQLATQTVTAEFDPFQMKQVMINLFTNAEEAMERGGRLKVTTAQVTTPDPKIRIEIEDTGPGIPPDAMANIFNPFFTTKSTGTGIGLAIVHRIITSHRGTIEVKNKPEGGASFVICLPCHPGPALASLVPFATEEKK
jgi:signal transduction histidine kinase